MDDDVHLNAALGGEAAIVLLDSEVSRHFCHNVAVMRYLTTKLLCGSTTDTTCLITSSPWSIAKFLLEECLALDGKDLQVYDRACKNLYKNSRPYSVSVAGNNVRIAESVANDPAQ